MPSSQKQDVEADHTHQLLQAAKIGDIQNEIFQLDILTDIYIQKKHWIQAAKLLNCAIALCEQNPKQSSSISQENLFKKLEHIEALFLYDKKVTPLEKNRHSVVSYRTHLKEIRAGFIDQCHKEESKIQEMMKALTNAYQQLLYSILIDCQTCLGPPPVHWACIGMGSMARGEMSLYSDLEYAFLIAQKTEETLAYFRTLAELTALRLINMGETRFPIFAKVLGEDSSLASPTKSGFSLDIGGNTPLGKPGFYELIDIPANLAQFQSETWMDRDIIVVNALSTVCLIGGDKALFNTYNKKKQELLNTGDGLFSFMGTPLRQKFALRMLKGHLQEFEPDLSHAKEKQKAFGIKKELYRPFQEVMNCLAIFYNLKAVSTIDRIQELEYLKVFSTEGAKNITWAVKQILSLRVEAHLFYQDEKEFLCHAEEGKPQESNLLYLSPRLAPNIIQCIREIYAILIPFWSSFKQFCIIPEKKTLNTLNFYDNYIDQSRQLKHNEKVSQQGDLLLTVNLHDLEIQAQQALSINPENIEALIQLSALEIDFGQVSHGIERAQRALALVEKSYDSKNQKIAVCYEILGDGLMQLQNYESALENYYLGLKNIAEGQSLNVADLTCKIAHCFLKMKELNQAFEYYQKALQIYLTHHGEEHCKVMSCYSGLGVVFEQGNDLEKAQSYHQKAINLAQKMRWKQFAYYALTADTFHSTGNFMDKYGHQLEEALACHQAALKIDLQGLNAISKAHPRIAKRYQVIGELLEEMGKLNEAADYKQKATILFSQIGASTN